jgi:apolipoprotein D and lipocalin family protein
MKPFLQPAAIARATQPQGLRRRAVHVLALGAVATELLGPWAHRAGAQPRAPEPLQALPSVDLAAYLGTWYQVALFPNFFQRQCVSDTTATYARLPDGAVQVVNRCRTDEATFDSVTGVARPVGRLVDDRLMPAQLSVSFLPGWLQWLPLRGNYWIIQLAEDGRYAVVSEPRREYLWVLSRTPTLAPADETAIRSRLGEQGFDLSRWSAHPQSAAKAARQP